MSGPMYCCLKRVFRPLQREKSLIRRDGDKSLGRPKQLEFKRQKITEEIVAQWKKYSHLHRRFLESSAENWLAHISEKKNYLRWERKKKIQKIRNSGIQSSHWARNNFFSYQECPTNHRAIGILNRIVLPKGWR